MSSWKLLLSPVIAISLGACVGEPAHPPPNPYPVGMTHTTNAEVPQVAAWLSPGLRVSGALAKRCDLHRDDVEAAPHFAFDASALDPEDEDALLQLAKCMTSGPLAGRTLTLAHDDETSGRTTRAQKYLIEYGVASDRLEVKARTPVAGEAAHRIHVELAR